MSLAYDAYTALMAARAQQVLDVLTVDHLAGSYPGDPPPIPGRWPDRVAYAEAFADRIFAACFRYREAEAARDALTAAEQEATDAA